MAERVASKGTVIEQARDGLALFLEQRKRAIYLDTWARGQQSRYELFMPNRGRNLAREYEDLADRSRAPWLPLVITSMVQTMSLEGVRRGDTSGDNIDAYDAWQENGFDAKQIPLYRSALEQGIAYVKVLPGRTAFSTSDTALWMPRSAKKMTAIYRDDDAEFPEYALEASQWSDANGDRGWQIELLDEQATHYLSCKGDGLETGDWEYISYVQHGIGFTPVVTYEPRTDLDGRAEGLIEPMVPLARRIDQDTFDRLIVQRYGAWKVRYATGMVKPDDLSEADWQAVRAKLQITDMLVGEGADTKFGTLEATELKGFIDAHDSDLRTLSAVSQTPPHHMLGLSSNMQAESLAAAEGGLNRHSVMVKTAFGESHERLMRLSALLRGNRTEASAFDMQVRWRDMEVRSLSQAADALGKLATQVGVPVPMLLEKIPGYTDYDVKRAMDLIDEGKFDAMVAALSVAGAAPGAQQQPQQVSVGADAG